MAGHILKILSFFALFFTPLAFAQSAPSWLRVDIGIIGVASDDILKDAIKTAKDKKLEGIVVVLDTPGGTLDATRTMVKNILASDIPIVVWVGPGGAHAGSAGAFITLAGHVAAMAPGTNIGAAHPVEGNGKDIDDESDMRSKVENDTAAFMESIAKVRGRNPQIAVSFVLTSLSITAEEALQEKVIDLISADTAGLLQNIDGREITLEDGRKMKISSKDATVLNFESNFRQDILTILSNPQLFYLLFIAGLIGIAIELTHPGVLFPGVLGGVSLILALIASSVIPVNFGAALLILLSVGLMIAELFLPSFGILGIGGIVGFVAGSALLIDSKSSFGLSLPWLTILPTTFVLVGFMALLGFLLLRNRRLRIQTGSEAMPGEIGIALGNASAGEGSMRVLGEIWNYREVDNKPVLEGDSLQVQQKVGLLLSVKLLGR